MGCTTSNGKWTGLHLFHLINHQYQNCQYAQVYPEIAQEAGIEGTVYVQFLHINEKGIVTKHGFKKVYQILADEAALAALKDLNGSLHSNEMYKLVFGKQFPVVFTLTN